MNGPPGTDPGGTTIAVSIILPLFEGERFIGDAIASVEGQTFRDFELVVVDDGSTDQGPSLVVPSERIRLLRRSHAGVAAARNAGLAATSGALVAFLDQDDRWTPGKLDSQVGRLRSRPDLDFVYAHQRLFLEPGFDRPAWVRERDLDVPRPGILPGTLVARRACFEKVGLHDETFAMSTDVQWFGRALDAGLKYEIMGDCLLERRIHAGNHSRLTGEGSAELLRALRGRLARRRGESA